MAKKKRPQARQRLRPKKTTKKNPRHNPKRRAPPRKKRAPLPKSKAEQVKRSEAAKRGWATRRANEAGALKPAWQRWVHSSHFHYSLTIRYPKPDKLKGKSGERRVREDAEGLMKRARERFPHFSLIGGIILYKRSSDGKRWDDGVVTKYLSWKKDFDEALAFFVSQAGAFYDDLTNPDRLQHAYKVKIVGLAVQMKLGRAGVHFRQGEQPTMPDVISLSREERKRRWLANA